ncbi:DsrE family protein [Fibrella sp. HMF5335]|uniref:DsrE family protein n=1 Tax=Fibrella rubiginis TaxID=2817060 RepID=A0A939K4V0_9BACT|nr:DsrE family protein [Fibrella rubiginis]MBO0936581.1 DsrE family protein [Fibrella rubiginis]
MKNTLFTLLCLFSLTAPALAQTQPAAKEHRVVFHLATDDTLVYQMVIRQVNNILNVWPTAKIEVLANSLGISMFRREGSKLEKPVQALTEKGVIFAVCQNSMRAMKLTKDDMLKQATYVPVGVAELVMKQEDGWSYIKAGF